MVVVEGVLLVSTNDFPSAFADFIGIIYAMNLEYPGKKTYEFIQAVLLKLGKNKLSPKVLSVYDKLMSLKNK